MENTISDPPIINLGVSARMLLYRERSVRIHHLMALGMSSGSADGPA